MCRWMKWDKYKSDDRSAMASYNVEVGAIYVHLCVGSRSTQQ